MPPLRLAVALLALAAAPLASADPLPLIGSLPFHTPVVCSDGTVNPDPTKECGTCIVCVNPLPDCMRECLDDTLLACGPDPGSIGAQDLKAWLVWGPSRCLS